MASDDITRQLRRADYLRQYFAATGREYATGRNIKCPNAAAHAHGDKNPSAKVYENPNGALVKCHGCGGKWDIFDLWLMDNGGTFPDAKQALRDRFGIANTPSGANASRAAHTSGGDEIEIGTAQGAAADRAQATPDKKTAAKITQYALTLQSGADGEAGRAYLTGRGISLDTARRFNVGFDPKAGWGDKRGGVVMPSEDVYMVRFLHPQMSRAGKEIKAMFYPEGKSRPLYNRQAIAEAAKGGAPVFIVEGEIDALSIAECGGVAVSTPAGSEIKVIEAVAKIRRGLYVPCMDRDVRGEQSQGKLVAALRKIGGEVIVYPDAPKILMPDATDGTHPKDANESLQRDAAAFRAAVAEVISKAQAYAKEESNPFGKERNGVFLRRFSDIPPTPPEEDDPDALIKGFALAKGEGWILAGEPSVGKSSFIQQLGFFAAAGKPFFGLEFMRPLKVFYLQTELQNRKIRIARNSFQYAARAMWGWTDAEYEQADGNIFYDDFMIGKTCDDLPGYLTRVFSISPFDLLLLDPLLTFIKDDPSLVKPTRELLYDQVTGVMGGREYKTPSGIPVKFGAIVLHHMGKTRWDNGKKVDRGMYSTAGSYVINAWPRIQLNLSKYAGDIYELAATKNPDDCTLTDENGDHAEKIFLRRAGRGERYWTQATQAEAEAAKSEADAAAKSGATPSRKQETEAERKQREDWEYRQAIQAFVAYLQPLKEKISKTDLRKWCIKTKGVFAGFQSHTVKRPDGTFAPPKPCYMAFEHLTANPAAYGVDSEIRKSYTYYGGVAPVTGSAAAQAEPSATTADADGQGATIPAEDNAPDGTDNDMSFCL